MKVIIHKEYDVTGCSNCPYYRYVHDHGAQWLECHHPEKSGTECPLGVYDPTGESRKKQKIQDSREQYKNALYESKNYRDIHIINGKNKLFWEEITDEDYLKMIDDGK